MSAIKLFPSGAWQVSAIVHGYLVTRTYCGYTKREALRLFREEYVPFAQRHRARVSYLQSCRPTPAVST